MNSRLTKSLGGGSAAAIAAATLLVLVPAEEGTVYRGYLDPVGIPTKCMGDTENVIVGRKYSFEECTASLNKRLADHAEPVVACVPQLVGRPNQLVAAVDLAYNIGSDAFCKSSIAKHYRAGRLAQACAGYSAWVYAKGKKLPGLVKRRAKERALCEKDL